MAFCLELTSEKLEQAEGTILRMVCVRAEASGQYFPVTVAKKKSKIQLFNTVFNKCLLRDS